MSEKKSSGNPPGQYVDVYAADLSKTIPSSSTYNAPSVADIGPATPASPDTQLAKEEAYKEETENRRTRLASNLLEQRHKLINDFGGIILVVVVALYLIFGISLVRLLLGGEVFHKDFPITAVILVGMSGSIPTILSLSFMVGLFSKEKENKEEKSSFDSASAAKVCAELIKAIKHS
jgi:hypothetical protein